LINLLLELPCSKETSQGELHPILGSNSPIHYDLRRRGAALGIYYLWNFVTSVILLNILISLFSSAYEDVVDDAEAEFLAFFAGKTIGMIR
jgi:hypothetical protein